MRLKIKSITLANNDHMSMKCFQSSEFESNPNCRFCGEILHPFIRVLNKLEEIGLETGICSKCGAVS